MDHSTEDAMRNATPTGGAVVDFENDASVGPGVVDVLEPDTSYGSEAASRNEGESRAGPGAYIDVQTQVLGVLAAQWTDTSQMRRASMQRDLPRPIIEAWELVETRTSDALRKALREHPMWPWLAEHKGMGGVHVARLMGRIRDPRRFPGQQCTQGHVMAPLYEVGDACPVTSVEGEKCSGVMLNPRTTTGVRSLWHYCGLHVVDGRSPRRQKGLRATWDMVARTSILQPDGIADAIIKNRTPEYRDIYDRAKARLTAERGADPHVESAKEAGPDVHHGDEVLRGAEDSSGSDGSIGPADIEHVHDSSPGEAETSVETDTGSGLRPFQIHERARKIAVKAFVGDLLIEWKRIVGSADHGGIAR